MAAVAMIVRGQSALTAMPLAAQLAGKPEHEQAHAELGDRVGGVRREPALLHIERRRKHQNVRIGGPLEMRDRQLRDDEGAARVDRVHEIEPLDVGMLHVGEVDGAGIVDENVDAAERCDRSLNRARNLLLVADVDGERQRAAARGLDLGRRGMDRPRQLRVGQVGLGDHGNIGMVARRPARNRETDAARSAGDEQGLAGERHRITRGLAMALARVAETIEAGDHLDRRGLYPGVDANATAAGLQAGGEVSGTATALAYPTSGHYRAFRPRSCAPCTIETTTISSRSSSAPIDDDVRPLDKLTRPRDQSRTFPYT